jgi:hypothetical protein
LSGASGINIVNSINSSVANGVNVYDSSLTTQGTNGGATVNQGNAIDQNHREVVSEMLEYIPASFKVIRHVRPKLCCTRCDAILQAAAPSRPIDRGLAGPGLLAHVLVAKYADHLPLYRVE